MKRIYLIICSCLLVILSLTSSGCCYLAGVGMDDAKAKTKARNDAWHKRMINAIENKTNKEK